MFVKIKNGKRKKYFELAHSVRNGAKVVQYSIYLGTDLNLSAQEWADVLSSTKFPVSIRKVFPVVEAFILRHGLPANTIDGLREAARLQWQQIAFSPAHKILGVPANATAAQIKAAFRRLSLTAHPDHGGDPVAFRKLVDARNKLLKSFTPTRPVPGAEKVEK